MTRNAILLLGAVATLAVTEIYHGPLGASQQLESDIERAARVELDRNEMSQVHADLESRPLSRTLILSGPADDFQRVELVRVMGELPGVAAVKWDPASLPAEGTAQ